MRTPRIALVATVAAALFGLTACGGGGGTPAPTSSPSSPAPRSAAPTSTEPVGSGCGQFTKSGKGSLQALRSQPVGTAITHVKSLSTLATALNSAELIGTVNKAHDVTVFAPDNQAFSQIQNDTLTELLHDKGRLQKIMKSHVVGKRLSPPQLVHGTFTSLAGTPVTVQKAQGGYVVNRDAHVVCGNIQTANATVYIIDDVLRFP